MLQSLGVRVLSAGRPPSWPRTWRGHRPDRLDACRRAATPTCPTSVASPLPSGGSLFDINDFDETLPGTVGMGRQAAGGQLRDRRSRPTASRASERRGIVAGGGRARYRKRDGASSPAMDALEVWYAQHRHRATSLRIGSRTVGRPRKCSRSNIAKAAAKDSLRGRFRRSSPTSDGGRPRHEGRTAAVVHLRDLAGTAADARVRDSGIRASCPTTARRSRTTGGVLLDRYRLVDIAREGRGRRQRGDALRRSLLLHGADERTPCSCR